MLNTVTFIREHGLAKITEDLAVIVKRHPQYGNLVFFKYNQIESPMNHAVVQECRGLILDEANDWAVVSYPFGKFFNYGDGNAKDIDWSTATVFEKLDGSLITMYYYDGKWQVASNGTPDAGGPVQGQSMTFCDLWRQTAGDICGKLDPAYCYMFELMTPLNRVIVPHEKPKFAMLGMRNLLTLEEEPHAEYALLAGMPIAHSYNLTTWDEITEAAKALNPMQAEGYVVCDAAFNRVKVKCPQYVALSHMKDGFSRRRMIELVRHNEGDEFLSYFPEYRGLFNEILDAYRNVVAEIESTYERIKGLTSQKEFALEATKTSMSGALFALRNGRTTNVKSYIQGVSLEALERMFSSTSTHPIGQT